MGKRVRNNEVEDERPDQVQELVGRHRHVVQRKPQSAVKQRVACGLTQTAAPVGTGCLLVERECEAHEETGRQEVLHDLRKGVADARQPLEQEDDE